VVTTTPTPDVGVFSITKDGREDVMVMSRPLGSTATTFTIAVAPAFTLMFGIVDREGAWAWAVANGTDKKSRLSASNLSDAFMSPP